MGHIYVDISIKGRKKSATKNLLVDTGATFTVLEPKTLKNLGLDRLPGKYKLELGDGRSVRADAYAGIAGIGDRTGPAIVISFKDAKEVIGVQTLESLGLRVNPQKEKLEPTRPKGVAYFY